MNQTTRPRLTEDGALSDDADDLPTMIKDAIYFTQRLDERFLWVDALCILQAAINAESEGRDESMSPPSAETSSDDRKQQIGHMT